MILTAEFWSALAAIAVINLALSGDNAIVIALAARKLPENLQRRAILLGSFGAVAVRVALTAAVLWVLTVPGLRFAGGLLLACIAYQLLTGNAEGGKDIAPVSGFWGAIRTIVVADAAMGLDNVLGVAGAAGGSLLLVVLGLAISIPIVVWGSALILTSIQRFPGLLYAGGTVLAWTAARMLTEEPLVHELLDDRAAAAPAVHVAIAGGTLGLAWLRNRRTAIRAHTEVLQ
ncbi:MAG TPA: TerC family protein [Burkholderiales bacterium]|nr:TerC family protein [Burkholderiales bacterium]